VPEEVRKQVGKAMEYRYEDATDWESAWFQQEVRKANAAAFRAYNDALAVGIAKEQARVVLPVNTYTTVTWTLNARALFNFLRLRLDSHAQSEAYEYAQQMEELAAGVIPDTVRAFIDAGRPKP
jgi:thymidylate synthase (FAD)